jgi:cytochrome c oxidase subunit 2
MHSQSAQVRVITVAVTTWSFSPATITAKKGEKVQLKLVGGEGIHSFSAPGLGLNVRVTPGQTVMVDLPTDTTGSFDVHCGIPCGPGHPTMQATVVIS